MIYVHDVLWFIHLCACACGSQWLISGVFLSLFLVNYLRHVLISKLTSRVHEAPGTILLSRIRIADVATIIWSFIVNSRYANLTLQTRVEVNMRVVGMYQSLL